MAKKIISLSPTYGYIYVISCDATTRVKIGYSGNPVKRLKQLQTGAPGKLTVERT